MPLLNIQTNVRLKSEEKDELIQKASKLVAQILGKPESYVMVGVQSDWHMLFADNAKSCAYVELKSLGLDESLTASYSGAICELLSQEAKIDSSRIYIEFSNAQRHLWGWDSKTF